MNKFFLDEEGEYFETILPQETSNGHVSVPQRPAPHWVWDGQEWVEGALQQEITNDDVNEERARRIASGCLVNLSGGDSFVTNTRPEDRENIVSMSAAAMTGEVSEFTYRDADNVDHTITATEMIELGLQVLQWGQLHYQASWALKAQDPIPQDFKDDVHWP